MSQAIEQLKSLSSAEDFFQALDVPFDPQVLRVARLHILKRMGQIVGALADDAPETEARHACREALIAAYEEFTQKTPIETRLFKVLRDRDPSRPATRGAFVPLSDLTG
ncbi:MAG: nitrogenase stabilizing/protective protein NifW [Rhodoblastus sp.]